MSSIKLENGIVLLKNGKPSCSCCDGGNGGGPIVLPPCTSAASCISNFNDKAGIVLSSSAAALFAGGTMILSVNHYVSQRWLSTSSGLYDFSNINYSNTYSFSVSGCSFGFQADDTNTGLTGTRDFGGIRVYDVGVLVGISGSITRVGSPARACLRISHGCEIYSIFSGFTRGELFVQTTTFSGTPNASSLSFAGLLHELNVAHLYPTQVFPAEVYQQEASLSMSLAFSGSAP